jgi:hypothetical protein
VHRRAPAEVARRRSTIVTACRLSSGSMRTSAERDLERALHRVREPVRHRRASTSRGVDPAERDASSDRQAEVSADDGLLAASVRLDVRALRAESTSRGHLFRPWGPAEAPPRRWLSAARQRKQPRSRRPRRCCGRPLADTGSHAAAASADTRAKKRMRVSGRPSRETCSSRARQGWRHVIPECTRRHGCRTRVG